MTPRCSVCKTSMRLVPHVRPPVCYVCIVTLNKRQNRG